MVNNVIRAVNYVIAARPSLLNFMIADSARSPPRVDQLADLAREAAPDR